ncbi:hypothetical protein VY88_25470 [Azospirillum thiophilum]|uniref:DUF6468 domain-containing protein n=1 Tax=Azospirillum thiophilum TaxID=528244 RepID=A0AAC8W4J8_9PROT|nr:DUF6468 domain-containing protein [Azospirillum thiophilum]ALG74924.1 hypothetical protein AL072_28390 [Azospirillum thiophilum]KJR62311.1 hypothetical protein VY88_25470 [Azospirillum thiophilum]
MVSFLIDAALAVMLVTATAYLVIVNKRLKLLRTGQSEINALVSTFSRSIDDTDASMKRMVASATDIATRLSDDLDRAKGVKEDMSLLLGSCERTATRMEESVQHARALLRRLDEGAMRTARNRPRAEGPDAADGEVPSSAPVHAAAPLAAPAPLPPVPAPPAPATMTEPIPTATLLSALKAAAEPGDGEFRALETALRATPAAPVATPVTTQAPAPVKAAASAFYARLRTVGSEG